MKDEEEYITISNVAGFKFLMQPTTTCDKMSGATTPTTWEFAVQDGSVFSVFHCPPSCSFFQVAAWILVIRMG